MDHLALSVKRDGKVHIPLPHPRLIYIFYSLLNIYFSFSKLLLPLLLPQNIILNITSSNSDSFPFHNRFQPSISPITVKYFNFPSNIDSIQSVISWRSNYEFLSMNFSKLLVGELDIQTIPSRRSHLCQSLHSARIGALSLSLHPRIQFSWMGHCRPCCYPCWVS